ncbi:hypothetical protein SLA2020_507710 [Shorea laevis]
MSIRNLLNCGISPHFLASWIVLSCFPGLIFSAVVTLDSIQIFETHEWLAIKPTIYFACKGQNKTVLPDVKKTNVLYAFKGEESWQPLTELESKRCKRCGIYEQDAIKSDDKFDEWEFCSSDFKDGKYIRVKEKEFNATFLCPQCTSLPMDVSKPSASDNGVNIRHIAMVIVISALVSTVMIIAVVAVYKRWQKKKRQQDQARFLKLFEDGDDIEDELGLGP